MEVRILHKFHDRVDYKKVYLVGETVTFDDARAESLIKRGLVERIEEPIEIEVESDTQAEDAEDAESDVVVDEDEAVEIDEAEESADDEESEEEAPTEETEMVAKRKRKPKNE